MFINYFRLAKVVLMDAATLLPFISTHVPKSSSTTSSLQRGVNLLPNLLFVLTITFCPTENFLSCLFWFFVENSLSWAVCKRNATRSSFFRYRIQSQSLNAYIYYIKFQLEVSAHHHPIFYPCSDIVIFLTVYCEIFPLGHMMSCGGVGRSRYQN